MVKDLLRSVEGLGIYQNISLVIFFAVFVGVVFWTIKLDRQHVQEMSELPLEQDLNTVPKG